VDELGDHCELTSYQDLVGLFLFLGELGQNLFLLLY
jgi:hypothetical protein